MMTTMTTTTATAIKPLFGVTTEVTVEHEKQKKDVLFEKEIEAIERVQDPVLKSMEILKVACQYADRKDVHKFVQIMEKYRGQYDLNSQFTFDNCQNHLVGHLSYNLRNMQCLQYLMMSDIRNEISQDQIDSSLNRAIEFQHESVVKAIMSWEYLDSNTKSMRENALEYDQEKSKIELLYHYLQQEMNPNDLNYLMKKLEQVIIRLIQNRQILSTDVFNLVWIHNKENLWNAMHDQCKKILNIDVLSENVCDWQWLKHHVLESQDLLCWLDMENHENNKTVNSINNPIIIEMKTNINNHHNNHHHHNHSNSNNVHSINTHDMNLNAARLFPTEKKMDKNNKSDNTHSKYNKIKWDMIWDVCDSEMKREEHSFQVKLKQEIDANEEKFKEICQFHCDELIDKKYLGKENEENLRQDKIKYGVHAQVTAKELEELSWLSNDHSFNPKQSYDYNIYLHQLLQRAHALNESFQKEMAHILYECKADESIKCMVKTYKRCKLKVEEEFRNKAFPKCGLILDVIRCGAVFESMEKLHRGLILFQEQIKAYREKELKKEIKIELIRVKNGFINNKRGVTLRGGVLSKKLQLPIPSTYTDIKFNVVFTDLRHNESIIGEVQFLLKSMVELHKKQYKLVEIQRCKNQMHGCLDQMKLNTFDFQLKMAGFNASSLCPLVLHHPLKFCKSELVLHGRDNSGDQFLGSMAYNSNVKYQCAKELITELIPRETVQQQLLAVPRSGAYPFMYAVWKQTSLDAIKLFIPENTDQSFWHYTDRLWYSFLHFGARNINVKLIEILKFLQQHIHPEKWEEFVVTQELSRGFTPLLFALYWQSDISEEVVRLLIPKNYEENYTFWEHTTNARDDQASMLHFAGRRFKTNILECLQTLHKFMPSQSWQKCLKIVDKYGYTPVMSCIRFQRDISDEILKLLTPEEFQICDDTKREESEIAGDSWSWSFWGQVTTNLSVFRGGNILHLCLANQCGNETERLQCLRRHIPTNIWTYLLCTRDDTLMKETPLELAQRMEMPQQVIDLLTISEKTY